MVPNDIILNEHEFIYSDKKQMLMHRSRLHFGLYEDNRRNRCLLVHFDADKVTSTDIFELVDTLIKIEAII